MIDCLDINLVQDEDGSQIWLIIGITALILVAIMITAFLVCWCTKRSGGGTTVALM